MRFGTEPERTIEIGNSLIRRCHDFSDLLAAIEVASRLVGEQLETIESAIVAMIGSRSRPMAKVPINDPKYWRERAEEARTVANEMTIPDAKRRTLRIADDYEELARRAERRLNSSSSSNSSNSSSSSQKFPSTIQSIGASVPKRPARSPTKWTTQIQSVRCFGLPTTMRNWRDVPSGG